MEVVGDTSMVVTNVTSHPPVVTSVLSIEENEVGSKNILQDKSLMDCELDSSDLDPNEPVLYQGSVFDSDDDEDYLVDPKRGPYQDNLKKRIKGFDEEEGRICPLVDRKSALLFDVVQSLEEEQISTSVKILQTVKQAGPIPLGWIQEHIDPNSINKPDFFDQWYIRILNEEKTKKSREDRIVDAELAKQRKLILGDDDTVATYAIPLEHGWSREVVVRIHPTLVHEVSETNPMSSIGEVFYRDPSGNKIRSMKQIAMTLEKKPLSGISIRNFTFAKAPIGVADPKKENIRKIISGRQSTAISPFRPPTIKGKKIIKDMSLYEAARNYPSIDMAPHSMEAKHKGSSSRRSIQPPKRYATGQAYIYPEKRSKMAGTKKDGEYHSDHEMEMGMLPPKYPRGKEDNSLTVDEDGSLIRRRGRPPKNIKCFEGSNSRFNGDDDSALFQISAFHNHSQSSLFQGIEDAAAQASTDEMHYGGMPHGMDQAENMGQEGGGEHGAEELLPCSIRCPGMTGEIPTLQCKHCLCLYHPECLALPPNLNFRNFFCANCEGEAGDDVNQPAPPPGFEAMKRLLHKSGKSMKKPPPPLLPAFTKMSGGGKFSGGSDGSVGKMFRMIAPKMSNMMQPPLGRGLSSKNTLPKMTSMSILRQPDDGMSMSISPITMKRGRGRPPKNTRLLPNLSSNRNLTITPISMRGPRVGPPPPLINLTPMGNARGGMAPPYIPPLPKMKGTQKLGPPVLNKPRQPGAIPSLTMTTSSGRLPDSMFNLKDMSRGMKQTTQNLSIKGLGLPPFRRYPQSVVSIGNKKFVAVPRAGGEVQTSGMNKGKSTSTTISKKVSDGSTAIAPTPPPTTTTSVDSGKQSPLPLQEKEVREENVGEVKPVVEELPSIPSTPHRFDSDMKIVEQIFKYLNVKDLMRASRVSRLWNAVGMNTSLWKVVRMKNHRISEIDAFTQFLKKQQTELVDFRKMISAGEMNWNTLFQSLSDVPSIKQVILGPRSSELMSSLSEHCPNIEVVN